MTVHWAIDEHLFRIGWVLVVVGALGLVVSGFVGGLGLTLLGAALVVLGLAVSISGVRRRTPAPVTTPAPASEAEGTSLRTDPAPTIPPSPLPAGGPFQRPERLPTSSAVFPAARIGSSAAVPIPAAEPEAGPVLVPAEPTREAPSRLEIGPPLVPEEPSWPPTGPIPPSPPEFSMAPAQDQGEPEGAIPPAGAPELSFAASPGVFPSPGGPSLGAVHGSGYEAPEAELPRAEPLAEPEDSPVSRWGGTSLPFAAATGRSQGIRTAPAPADSWPPVMDRAQEELREEVERLRQRVEELSSPVLVPGFSVLPAPLRPDTLGLVSRVPEPPAMLGRPAALCIACGDADAPGPSGGHRCWGCGRPVCSNCFWRYGPGPGLHRCPGCAGQAPSLTISGGRRSLGGTVRTSADDSEFSEGL
jgi:hypothetical protein